MDFKLYQNAPITTNHSTAPVEYATGVLRRDIDRMLSSTHPAPGGIHILLPQFWEDDPSFDMDEILGLGVDISEKIKPHAWEKLPWRWVVERTLSWLGNSRRLSKDYENTVDSAEAIVKISHLHTLLKRL